MKRLTPSILAQLSDKARLSPRLRANSNLHDDLADPIQRLANAMEPGTLIPPHRHPQTWEILSALHGRFVVLVFDDKGRVIDRAELGVDTNVVEIPANAWHAVLSRDTGGVIFEVKKGPYTPIAEADLASWCKNRSATELNAWYAEAQLGDELACG